MYISKPHKRNAMIEIEKISLDECYRYLKPYQRNIIEQLVTKYGIEKAAEEWINARGPMQTVTFGGVVEDANNKKNYWNRFKNEFDKLICGHPDYQNDQEKFITAGKPIGLGAIAYIANLIAPAVGMSSAVLIPAIVLVFNTTAKMGVKAYCATKQFDNSI